jgi:hypothetical protein
VTNVRRGLLFSALTAGFTIALMTGLKGWSLLIALFGGFVAMVASLYFGFKDEPGE